MSAAGQAIALPAGTWNRLYALVASVRGPAMADFAVDGRVTRVPVQDWSEPIAQWNNRLVAGSLVEEDDEIAPAWILRAPVAWYGTHRHAATEGDTSGTGRDEAYRFTYLYRLELELPPGARSLTLPRNERVKLLAASVAATSHDAVRATRPLYDVADEAVVTVIAAKRSFIDSTEVRLATAAPGAEIRYSVD
jgi:alpha-mannosidase